MRVSKLLLLLTAVNIDVRVFTAWLYHGEDFIATWMWNKQEGYRKNLRPDPAICYANDWQSKRGKRCIPKGRFLNELGWKPLFLENLCILRVRMSPFIIFLVDSKLYATELLTVHIETSFIHLFKWKWGKNTIRVRLRRAHKRKPCW